MTIRTLAVGNNNMDQVDHRSLVTGLGQSAGAVSIRSGLFPSNPAPGALSNVSAMVVGVGALKGIVLNQSGSGQFLVQSDATINLTFDAGEASVARVDRIILRVYNVDQDGNAGGVSDAAIEYLKGQSSGSASALPNGSLLLWEVSVPAGASAGGGGINFTSTAVDKRAYTTATGGIIPTGAASDLASVANAYEGMAFYAKDIDVLYIHDGTSFKPRSQVNVAASANLSSVVNPYDGLLATVRDTNYIYQYDGAAWVGVGIPGLDSAWTAYTPVWTASSTAPNIGNGTVTGAYKKIGKTVFFRIKVAPGSTTTFGNGNYSLTLPTGLAVADEQVASAIFRDNDVATEYPCVAWLQSGTSVLHIVYGAGVKVGNATPVTWANGDRLEITGVYETL